MPDDTLFEIAQRRYRERYAADIAPSYARWVAEEAAPGHGAVLGYRDAAEGPLFLETYLDSPIEAAIAEALHRPVSRNQIVEIGSFAADNCLAMARLWASAASRLVGSHSIAVATLTRPMRAMFARIGLPLTEIAVATADRLDGGASRWGRYYDEDPRVCVGLIADGQAALATFFDRGARRKVA